jgi:thiamine-monophosphate kinase
MPLPEKVLIAEIRRLASSRRSRGSRAAVMAGIGDDCAVLRPPPGHEILVTTDFTLEGIHFRREWHAPEVVGHRCLTRGLSDIAAMGGQPLAAFLSLALPRDLPQAWVRRFIRGLIELGNQYGAPLAGGDTAESPNGILADIVVVGSVPKGKAVLRSGARPGDRIYVSGELGGSAAALQAMREEMQGKRGKGPSANFMRGYARHFYPEPRIELGRILRQKGLASAMIDLSDGLSTDLAHICEESGVGADISADLIPRAKFGKPAREVSHELALHGGEDYELIFTAPPGKRLSSPMAGVAVTQIGVITRAKGAIFLVDSECVYRRLRPQGWEHFRE